jgi:hypothetical protein
MTLDQAERIADALHRNPGDTADIALGVLLDELRRVRAELQLAGTIALDRKMQLDRLRVIVAMCAHNAVELSNELSTAATAP